MSEKLTYEELRKLLPKASEYVLRKSCSDRVAPSPEPKPNPRHEPVGKDEGKADYSLRRSVRVTSYRIRLCDERNLYDKHFIDALVRAGLLVDDSPEWCQVEVKQELVKRREEERTEIVIESM